MIILKFEIASPTVSMCYCFYVSDLSFFVWNVYYFICIIKIFFCTALFTVFH